MRPGVPVNHRQNSQTARFAWTVLGVNLLVILWGAFVRATGSGAGCGSHWPLCNGEVLPQAPSTATLIELTHRLTSGVALILTVVLLVKVLRAFERGHPARAAAVWSMIFMLGEAAIGAGIVLFELVADNASIARALFMGTHLGNTFLLLACMALTAYWSGGGQAIPRGGHGRLGWLSSATLAAVLLIGVSGAISALGDTLYPPSSHGEAIAESLSPTAHVLVQLRVLHPLIAVLGSLLVFYLTSTVRRKCRTPEARRAVTLLNLLVTVQLAMGLINITLMAPIALQLIHLLLADLVWIGLVLTVAIALASRTAPTLDASVLAAVRGASSAKEISS